MPNRPTQRSTLSSYPLQSQVQTRFGDTDVLQHLNNVALASIYEDARFALSVRLFGRLATRGEVRTLIVAVNINYLREGRYPGMLQAGCGVARIGRSSFVIGQALFQDGACIGTADTTIVHTDAVGPRPIPDNIRADMGSYMIGEAQTDGG